MTDQPEWQWKKGGHLGTGRFGQMHVATSLPDGLTMAVRQVEIPAAVDLLTLPEEEQERHRRQHAILNACEREVAICHDHALQHENIVKYLHFTRDAQYVNVFFEYVCGGSVAFMLSVYGGFREPLVKNFTRQILRALDYLHDRGIIHAGVRCGHMFSDNEGLIKLCGPRILDPFDTESMTNSTINSIFTTAPDVIQGGQWSLKADIWSMGCAVVAMFTASHPFPELTPEQAFSEIGHRQFARPATPPHISREAQHFLWQAFSMERERPSAAELLDHPWMRIAPEDSLSLRELIAPKQSDSRQSLFGST
ncbi:kinase-like domain-containing protein [Mycena crocata]|nr:kinase-like domain-containing protein [Mycena crocata]